MGERSLRARLSLVHARKLHVGEASSSATEQHLQRIDAEEQHDGANDQQRCDAHAAFAADRNAEPAPALAHGERKAAAILPAAVLDVLAFAIAFIVAHGAFHPWTVEAWVPRDLSSLILHRDRGRTRSSAASLRVRAPIAARVGQRTPKLCSLRPGVLPHCSVRVRATAYSRGMLEKFRPVRRWHKACSGRVVRSRCRTCTVGCYGWLDGCRGPQPDRSYDLSPRGTRVCCVHSCRSVPSR